MTEFYRKAHLTSTGGVMGPNKGVIFNSGPGGATAFFHTVESSNYGSSGAGAAGLTTDLQINLPANETMIVPVQIYNYHQNSSENSKIYKLN